MHGGSGPLRWHGHVQHGNGGSHNATRCASAADYCHYACNQQVRKYVRRISPQSTFSTGIDVRLSLQPAADKASMTCSHLAIYLATYLSSLPSSHPCINLTFSLSLSLSCSLSLSLSLSLCRPHLCIYVAMRSSLPTIHAIMWCF